MIKTVLFDIDNTLYDFDHANLRALDAVGEYTQREFGWDAGSFRERNRNMMQAMHARMGDVSAYHNRLIRFQNMLEQEGLPLYPHALRMYQLYWDTVIETAVVSPGAEDVLRGLKEQGYRIGIGTDMTAWIQFQKLERLQLLPYIDFLVSSEEACAEKPTKPMFDLCVKKAGCTAGECLFIGDSLERDYRGAKNAGMHALWFVPPGGTFRGGDAGDEPVPQIDRLEQIFAYLKNGGQIG